MVPTCLFDFHVLPMTIVYHDLCSPSAIPAKNQRNTTNYYRRKKHAKQTKKGPSKKRYDTYYTSRYISMRQPVTSYTGYTLSVENVRKQRKMTHSIPLMIQSHKIREARFGPHNIQRNIYNEFTVGIGFKKSLVLYKRERLNLLPGTHTLLLCQKLPRIIT